VARELKKFFRQMDDGARYEFEKLYPESVYDATARHRAIVSGELGKHDFSWWFLERMEGVFFWTSNVGERSMDLVKLDATFPVD
jgi:hypothetical protein